MAGLALMEAFPDLIKRELQQWQAEMLAFQLIKQAANHRVFERMSRDLGGL